MLPLATITTGLRVLVVDDDPVCLEITAALLAALGCEVSTRAASIGTGGVLLHERPDVVLLDVGMPGLTGDKVLELLKRRGVGDTVTLLLHSALPEDELAEIARRCGAAGWITKSSQIGAYRAALARFSRTRGRPEPRHA